MNKLRPTSIPSTTGNPSDGGKANNSLQPKPDSNPDHPPKS